MKLSMNQANAIFSPGWQKVKNEDGQYILRHSRLNFLILDRSFQPLERT
jgi:hypothetical protein